MKILISSHAFAPSIGGIETVSALLADEFVRLGHPVTMVTQTPADKIDALAYRIMRQPSLRELGQAIKWSDIFWQNNLSLRTLWPALLASRPIVITHQGSYCRAPRGIDFLQRCKHFIVGRTKSVAISEAVADCFSTGSTIIHNPYDARNFPLEGTGSDRTSDLVFLGRLVSEKGVDLLLEALAILRTRKCFPSLTILGSGPELSSLQQLTTKLGLDEQVTFRGAKGGEELRALLRQHKILAVPSR
ncbi:MAG: glycosyltransferase family 4 protein, partial [Chthoniobacterales bacterium]